MAFSRRESIERTPVDLNGVVAEVRDMLQRVIGANIRLEIRSEDELWAVRSDPTQLEQVVMNLAVNSRDAMPRGGLLEIRTRNVEVKADAEDRRPDGLDPGRYVVLEVEDTGTGIPRERIARIFEPFYSSKGPGRRSGLGLAMVYGIVRQNQGLIDVDTAEGEGITFSIFLPADSETGAEEGGGRNSGQAQRAAPRAEYIGKGATTTEESNEATILLLQHDPAVRATARRVLRRNGYSVLEADDAEAAAESCREWRDPIDLVLSDGLDDEDDRLVRTTLSSYRTWTPVLWTWEPETETPPPAGPANGLLRKPFSTREHSRRLRELLADVHGPEDAR